jgi:DNA-binding beta-propeller fold protein YncE
VICAPALGCLLTGSRWATVHAAEQGAGKVYVTSRFGGTVSVIDLQSGTVTGAIMLCAVHGGTHLLRSISGSTMAARRPSQRSQDIWNFGTHCHSLLVALAGTLVFYPSK